jgi:hypothetical protein
MYLDQIMLNKILFTIFLSVGGFSLAANAEDDMRKMIVYKSPTCGCCNSWISHMKSNGFTVQAVNKDDMTSIKNQFGIDGHLQSCHTAIDTASGYFFEGHVPAVAVKRFLSSPPEGAKGLSVPGMVAGSPGMEMGSRFDPYQIVQINKDKPPTLFMNVQTQPEQYAVGTQP